MIFPLVNRSVSVAAAVAPTILQLNKKPIWSRSFVCQCTNDRWADHRDRYRHTTNQRYFNQLGRPNHLSDVDVDLNWISSIGWRHRYKRIFGDGFEFEDQSCRIKQKKISWLDRVIVESVERDVCYWSIGQLGRRPMWKTNQRHSGVLLLAY